MSREVQTLQSAVAATSAPGLWFEMYYATHIQQYCIRTGLAILGVEATQKLEQ